MAKPVIIFLEVLPWILLIFATAEPTNNGGHLAVLAFVLTFERRAETKMKRKIPINRFMIKILEAHDFSYEKIYPGCCFLNFLSISFMQISPHLPRTVPEKEKSDLIRR